MQILCRKQLRKVQDTVQFYYTVLHDKFDGDSYWDLNPQRLRVWLPWGRWHFQMSCVALSSQRATGIIGLFPQIVKLQEVTG